MLIETLEMRNPCSFIAVQDQFFQLRHGDLESVLDSSQSRFECLSGRARQLLQEVSTKWIARLSHGPLRLTYKLGNQMEISDLRKEIRQHTKWRIGIQLLKMGLTQSFNILVILGIRSIQKQISTMEDSFACDHRYALIVLAKLQEIRPASLRIKIYLNLHSNVGVSAGVQRTNLRHSMAGLNGSLKASLWLSNVPKKAKGLKEIGFPRCIRTDQEGSLLKRNVCLQEIPPVLELQASESHNARAFRR